MGTSIAVLHVLVGVNFRKTGVWPSLCDVAVSWLRLQTPIDCIPYPYWMLDVYKVFEHLEMLWMENGYTLMPFIHCAGGGEV